MSDRFKLYTGLLKAYEAEGPDGVKSKRFRTTASSTTKDLAGDEIEYPAIEKMASQARNNMTIFLNHSYNVPEDVLGSCLDAQVMKRGLDEHGADIVDLDFEIGLNESNPRAIQAWESIKSGVKLGTSIGAIVRHATKKKGGGIIIDDLDLLEASLVGIPANPRSWVHYAMKSLNSAEEPLLDIETEEDFEITEAADTAETLDPTVEPDKEAARTRVTVTVDSEPAQEAPKSEPGNAKDSLLDETAQGDDEVLGDNVTRDTSSVDVSMAALVTKLTDLTGQVLSMRKDLEAMAAERDAALANLDLAKQLFSRIEQLPLRRKTAPILDGSTTPKSYQRLSGIYDSEVIKLLEKK